MIDIYKDIGEYNSNEKPKILILFDDLITNVYTNKNWSSGNRIIY